MTGWLFAAVGWGSALFWLAIGYVLWRSFRPDKKILGPRHRREELAPKAIDPMLHEAWSKAATSRQLAELPKRAHVGAGFSGIIEDLPITCLLWKGQMTCLTIQIQDLPLNAAWVAICCPSLWKQPLDGGGYLASAKATGIGASLFQRKESEGRWAVGAQDLMVRKRYKEAFPQDPIPLPPALEDCGIFADKQSLYLECPDVLDSPDAILEFIDAGIQLTHAMLAKADVIREYIVMQIRETQELGTYLRFLEELVQLFPSHEVTWATLHQGELPAFVDTYKDNERHDAEESIWLVRILLLFRHYPAHPKTQTLLQKMTTDPNARLQLLAMMAQGWALHQDAISTLMLEQPALPEREHWEILAQLIDMPDTAQREQIALLLAQWNLAIPWKLPSMFKIHQSIELMRKLGSKLNQQSDAFRSIEAVLLRLLKFQWKEEASIIPSGLGIGKIDLPSVGWVQCAAAEALGEIGSTRALTALEKYTKQWTLGTQELAAARAAIAAIHKRFPAAEKGMLSLHADIDPTGALSHTDNARRQTPEETDL